MLPVDVPIGRNLPLYFKDCVAQRIQPAQDAVTPEAPRLEPGIIRHVPGGELEMRESVGKPPCTVKHLGESQLSPQVFRIVPQ